MKSSIKLLAAALTIAVAPGFVAPAAATPISLPIGLQNAIAPSIEAVQYRRGWGGGYQGGGYRGGGFGGAAFGLAAGALLGGAIIGATQQPYGYYGSGGYGPGYAYSPGYAYAPGYAPGYVAVSPYGGGGGDAAYCLQRFRSYDPGSGTYLGFDGLRHPCP
ncbi:MAG: BA14K family protein [Rhodoplanes sp.]|nr:BA14K family protein [Rhodoplanes sp.]